MCTVCSCRNVSEELALRVQKNPLATRAGTTPGKRERERGRGGRHGGKMEERKGQIGEGIGKEGRRGREEGRD